MSGSTHRSDWITAAGQGDQLALVKLLTAYYPMLARRAERRMDQVLRARVEPEDILQEVYLDVLRQASGFSGDDEDAFVAWITTILESKIIDAKRALRRRKRDVARERPVRAARGTESYWSLLDQVYKHSETPSRVVRREEAVGALLASIPRLPEAQRLVIELRFMEELPVRETAARLGRTEAATVALTRRALASLRDELDRLA